MSGVSRELHYIDSPAGLIAIVVRESGSDAYHYVYTDHLGSILTVTNSAGTVEAEQNFDAWGRRRGAATWDYYGVVAPPDWLYRGYTGHEMLDPFVLINMNGRIYDPVLGRVLSPDNFVQDPFSTQGFNRYSYGFNNPLKYSDPTGQLFILDNLILGLTGGVFNLLTNLGNLKSGWQALGYFGVGFGAGFVSGYGQIALSGAILSAGNAALGGASFGQIALSGVVGAATGVGGAKLSKLVTPYLTDVFTDIASPVIQQGLTNLVAGGAVGGVLGGVGAGITGNNILAGIGSGLQIGALSGGLNGVAGGLVQAGRNGVNPWTGRLRSNYSTTEFPSGNNYTIPHDAVGVTVKGNGSASTVIPVPSGWTVKPSIKNGGVVYKDPTNPHNNIRQMPGNSNSPNPAQQNPYVIYKKNGVAFDANGNPLPRATHPDAHIPVNNFDINKMPKF